MKEQHHTRWFPLPGDVHRGPEATDTATPVEDRNRADASFASGVGGTTDAPPAMLGKGSEPNAAKAEKKHDDKLADEASEDSFPASDPPAFY